MEMNAEQKPLEFLKRPGSKAAKAVIFFHGYGADQADLYPLADIIDPKKEWNWYFPNGLLQAIVGPGMFGRAWFPLDMARFERNMREGKTSDLSGDRPPQLNQALQAAGHLYEQVSQKHSDIVLGGFSQGSVLATRLALLVNPEPKGLVIWSGSLVDKKGMQELLAKRTTVPFIQSHGVNDTILGFEYAENLFRMLTENQCRGEWLPFQGGHEIPMAVLKRTGDFIRSVF